MNKCEVDSKLLNEIRFKISSEYMPIFTHLYQKIGQKALFDQKGLIICARSRTIYSEGKPYIFNRKRNLTLTYLK